MRRVTLLFALLLAASALACGDDPFGPRDIAGTYTLAEANGEPLPALVRELSGNASCSGWWLLSGALSVNADGTYGMVLQFDCSAEGGTSSLTDLSCAGQYALSGRSLTFTTETCLPSEFTGSVSAGAIIVVHNDVEMRYERSG